jgi:phage shock protein PspC (stress-responsive transcriptional regulator)
MSLADEIERLQSLRQRGALSEEEFQRAKARLLDQPPAAPRPDPAHDSFLHRLSRARHDRVIGGVCGGFGRHTGLPSWVWRVLFCAAAAYFGVGILLYLLLWVFMPLEPP